MKRKNKVILQDFDCSVTDIPNICKVSPIPNKHYTNKVKKIIASRPEIKSAYVKQSKNG